MFYGSYFEKYVLYGWNFDSVESLKDAYNEKYNSAYDYSWDSYIDNYRRRVYASRIEPLFKSAPINFNLGGENEKSRIEFTDRPVGVFDFSLASQNLFRPQEYFSQKLRDERPERFSDYGLPSGIVPNYYVESIGTKNKIYLFQDEDGTEFMCEVRQKGLTDVLDKNPSVQTIIDNGMLIPTKYIKGVVFASNTKKPYIKYKRSGGKVKYVEIYSLHYYTRMSGDFQYAVRHIPILMVSEYLEKMGVLTKLYVTRFVTQRPTLYPREKDVDLGVRLPLYTEFLKPDNYVEKKSRDELKQLVVQPMCVKDYGQEIDKAQFFCIGSDSMRDVYEASYDKMKRMESAVIRGEIYGNPDFEDMQYQEGFERFRQKQMQYVKKGVWAGKEVQAGGLIYFHDVPLNKNFNSVCENIKSAYRKDYDKWDNIESLIVQSPSISKWFEIWMRISAMTIKHKFDIANADKPAKVYREIFKYLDETIFELDDLIRKEPKPSLKEAFDNFKSYAIRWYKLDRPNQYITDKINEMTVFASGDYFGTPDESAAKRNEEAERLLSELEKV